MLIRVAKRLRRLYSFRSLGTRARTFYHSALLSQKKDKEEIRYMKPCPDVPDCLELNKESCSPTDAVRPCPGNCNKHKCCVSSSISQNPCKESGNSKDFKKQPPPFNSMWETYEGKKYAPPVVQWDYPKDLCCPQCDAYRFDVLYYTPGNKNRNYQRTWWECTPRMVPKRVCCWCDAVPPQVQRRVIPKCPESACQKGHEKKRMECLNKTFKGCPRLQMPCCRTARMPTSCKIFPTPSDCEKVKCPFPSYSECNHDELVPSPPKECKCLDHNPICVQIRMANRMSKHNISIFPCCRGEKEGKKGKEE